MIYLFLIIHTFNYEIKIIEPLDLLNKFANKKIPLSVGNFGEVP